MSDDVFGRLANHLAALGMGYPYRDDLLAILRENLNPTEAEVCLLFPNRVGPCKPVAVDVIAPHSQLSRVELEKTLESLAERGLIFSGQTAEGGKGYALQQVGFGFPQTFFWKGEDTPQARTMTNLIKKYFDRKVTQEAFGGSETKPHRYIPVKQSIKPDLQAVYSLDMMEDVINQAQAFAVAHCTCRFQARLHGSGCNHPLEVCLKFDELAEYLIDRGLGRRVTREEALGIVRKSEEAGLVHFVDNAYGKVKHNCNCCGCACWNVGTIKRRKITRDVLMATYFLRETEETECIGCGNCLQACHVDAVVLEDSIAAVDQDWCIGCGVCVPRCPTGAAVIVPRTDKKRGPFETFDELHEQILKEKGLK